jgi:catechol 2,3-dioxygenase-like lactoylglutathione lyase family enzyme
MAAANDRPVLAETHLSLNVADVDRSVAFYEAFFGAPAHKRRPGYANFDLGPEGALPPLKLALQQNPPRPGAGSLDHLGIQVAAREQVAAARDRLLAAGLATFDEGDTTCCYALQDKVWVQDPDGNRWEVYVLLDDMLEEEASPPGRGEEPACCAPAEGCCG